MKEFNRLNDYSPHLNIYNSQTGDVIQLNKGFFYGMLTDQESEQENSSKFDFLADNAELAAEYIDFSDPASLMRRQKRILEKIQKH